MAKNDRDLFNRLRNLGVRKQAAKALSGIGEDTGKKALKAARSAVSELRSLADDIESRLPSLPGASSRARASGTTRTTRSRTASRSAAAKPAARKPAARKPAARKPAARKPAARKPAASTSTASRSTASRSTASRSTARRSSAGGRAPRGANKAKILAALSSGPKTASEIAKETGIGVGTVGSTLTKMAGSGEVQKAARGYALPS